MMYYLKANKTKMVKLLRRFGHQPVVSQARFEKMFCRRSYTLLWKEPSGVFDARLFTAGGVSHLRVAHDGDSKMIQVSLTLLMELDMVEPAQSTPVQ